MVNSYIPDRGDIIHINFNPQTGKEQAGIRPALVISPSIYNQKVGLAILCPITKQKKGYPFEVIIDEKSKTEGVILSDHLKNLDYRARKAKFVEKISPENLQETLAKISTLVS